jgi:protein in recF-gyrB intergenic region
VNSEDYGDQMAVAALARQREQAWNAGHALKRLPRKSPGGPVLAASQAAGGAPASSSLNRQTAGAALNAGANAAPNANPSAAQNGAANAGPNAPVNAAQNPAPNADALAPWDAVSIGRIRRRQERHAEIVNGQPVSQARVYWRDPRSGKRELDGFFHRQGWEESLRIASVKVRWEEIVGKDMAENCSIYSFKNGRLVMRAHSTNWAQQLQLMMPQLEALFEREVGPGIVKSIKVRGPNADYTWQHGKLAVPGARGVRDTYG